MKKHPVQQARKGRAVLDIKGLLMHSYFRTTDKGATARTEEGKPVTRFQEAFRTFLTSYIDQIIETQGFAPIDIIAVWDAGHDYRTALYSEYKANRTPQPPEIQTELDKLYKLTKNFLAALGTIQVQVDGVEADDVIAYLAPAIQPFCNVYTVDNDLVQLASDTVGVFVREEEKDSYQGVPAKFIALYKSIVGDTSDHYGGVYLVGEKGWQGMVDEFGWDGMAELEEYVQKADVSDILALAAEVNDPTVDKMAKNAADWVRCYQLAILHPELCHGFKRGEKIEPKWFKRVPSDRRLRSTLEPCGLGDLYSQYEQFCVIQYLMTGEDELADIFEDIGQNAVAFDYESYDPEPQASLNEAQSKGDYVNVLQQKLTGASFCFGSNMQYVVYVPVFHKSTYLFQPSVIAEVLQMNQALIVHNAAFEKTVTDLNLEPNLVSNLCDTQLMSSHVDENQMSHSLKDLSRNWLGYEQMTYKEVLGDNDNMSQLTGKEVLRYGCDDSLVTAHLWSLFDLITMVEGSQHHVYRNEFHFNDVMGKAFQRGIPTDQKLLNQLEKKDQALLEELDIELRNLLREHCKEVPEDAVAAFMQENMPFYRAKAESQVKEKGGNFNEILEATIATMEKKWRSLSVYNEFIRTDKTEEFIPTLKKLEKLLKLADMEAVGLPASMAAARVTAWLSALQDASLPDRHWDILNIVAEATAHFKTRDPEGLHPIRQLYHKLQVEKGQVKVDTEGDDLNTDSPDQMQSLLYLKLRLPVRHRSKPDYDSFRDRYVIEGAPSTADKAVEFALAEDAPEGSWKREILLILREIKSTLTKFKYYYRPYPKWIHNRTGRIHPQIKNCGTNSRRPTSSGPNELQVKKGEIRQIYLPLEEDHILISPDFNGQEIRVVASESRDPALLDAYLSTPHKDVHSLTASSFAPDMVKRLYPDLAEYMDLTDDGKHMLYESFIEWLKAEDPEDQDFKDAAGWMRSKRAKAVNFLAMYVGGAQTLSLNLLIPEQEAQELLDSMYSLYGGLQPWQRSVADLARKQGFVRSVYGSVRHATKDIVSQNGGFRSRMERQLVNFLAQGTSADILKVVVREIDESNLLEETESYLVAPVYDEVLCSAPVSRAVEFCQRLQRIMDLTPPTHQIPMMSEFKLGFSWGDMVEIGTDTSKGAVEAGIEEARKKIEKRRAGE